jgi:aryl-alcohol dehydrogenase-like predicted oxidoreductase
MEYRQLGKSNLKPSAIVYGAWAIGGSMWGKADEADAVAAIRTSIDLGINAVDTAPLYGFGQSERLVGQALAGRRDKVLIFTKYCLRADRTEGEFFFTMDDFGKPVKVYKNARKEAIYEECERSLRDLGTDYIDLYQCHWRDNTTPVEETMEAMARLIEQGKIRAAGVSNFTVEEIEACNKVIPLASDQPPFSMVNRGAKDDILPFCLKNKIGIVVYSPMQRGLLTGKFKPDHKFDPYDHRAGQPHFKPQNIRRINTFLEGLRPIMEEHNATTSQVVVNWTIQQPGITSALVGARNAEQARENAGAGAFMLTLKEVQEITARLDELKLDL